MQAILHGEVHLFLLYYLLTLCFTILGSSEQIVKHDVNIFTNSPRFQKQSSQVNHRLQSYLTTSDGRLVAHLVREFLAFFDLRHTLREDLDFFSTVIFLLYANCRNKPIFVELTSEVGTLPLILPTGITSTVLLDWFVLN